MRIAEDRAVFISEFKVSYVDALERRHQLQSQFQSEGLKAKDTFIAGTLRSD
jgi:hypothetical protein